MKVTIANVAALIAACALCIPLLPQGADATQQAHQSVREAPMQMVKVVRESDRRIAVEAQTPQRVSEATFIPRPVAELAPTDKDEPHPHYTESPLRPPSIPAGQPSPQPKEPEPKEPEAKEPSDTTHTQQPPDKATQSQTEPDMSQAPVAAMDPELAQTGPVDSFLLVWVGICFVILGMSIIITRQAEYLTHEA